MTVGGFGHGRGICERLSGKGTYIGLDLDADALDRARAEVGAYPARAILAKTNFKRFVEILAGNGIDNIDGCIMDLGVSSYQLDEGRRGFSFLIDGDLDMRMDMDQKLTAADVVNRATERELADIFSIYGEERFAKRIAAGIVEARKAKRISTTRELASLAERLIPRKFHVPGRHPATKIFQGLRIRINDELTGLGDAIKTAIDQLNPGGRMVVISFHSLEDRIAKQAFVEKAKGCICPKDFPVCVCHNTPKIKILTKTPVTPSSDEVATNPRSRSAKLRVAEKLEAHME
jgi:16S rRNA (cytosine1402-N4)-methyltransferase